MALKDNKIDFYTQKLVKAATPNSISRFESIVFSEAINLLNSDVNPDKVDNWVNKTLSTFSDKPKPPSAREIMIAKDKEAKKLKKKQKIEELTKELDNLVDMSGLVIMGFFERIGDETYNLFIELSKKNDFFFNDFGDGAYEPIITKIHIDKEFFQHLNNVRYELGDLTGTDPLRSVHTDDSALFIAGLLKETNVL